MQSQSESTNGVRVVPVPVELVGMLWGLAAPILQRAIEEGAGELDILDVYERVQDKRMHLLLAVEEQEILAAFVTEVVQYPKKKAIRVVLGAGEAPQRWKQPLRDMLKLGARAVGAASLEVWGRPGWHRLWKDEPAIKLKYHVIVEDL